MTTGIKLSAKGNNDNRNKVYREGNNVNKWSYVVSKALQNNFCFGEA